MATDQASKVAGLVRLSRVERHSDAPRYEVWWLDEQNARLGVSTAEFRSLNLSREVDGESVTDLVIKPELARWQRGAFYWAALVGVVSLVGYTATLSEAWQWLFGPAEGSVQVELEEMLKPRAVGSSFRLTVGVHNSKRYGRLWIERLIHVGESDTFHLESATSAGRIPVEPGKTEKFDYIARSERSGKVSLNFKAEVQAGVLRRTQTLSAPAVINVWKGRDDTPELDFIAAEFPEHPRFEVVLRNSEARKRTEIEVNFTDMNVFDPMVGEPLNAGSVLPGTLTENPGSRLAQYRFVVMDSQPLQEVRIPFEFSVSSSPTQPWKNTKNITVFAQ